MHYGMFFMFSYNQLSNIKIESITVSTAAEAEKSLVI
jgi:hypothetical protein